MKGILVAGMVFAHVYQLTGTWSRILEPISLLTNLVSFSGFFFCFGFASWLAYLQKHQLPWRKILKTAAKCYIAFIISGVAYRVLVDAEEISLKLVFRIATIRDIPAYAEFLLAFALITILGALFKKGVSIMTRQWQNLLLTTLICLGFTLLLPSSISYDPIIGLFIGSNSFNIYPIIQYLPVFLLGVFVARNPNQFNLRTYLFFSIFGLGLSLVALVIAAFFEAPITRFPPSFFWILCSMGLVFLYRSFAHIVHESFPLIIKGYFITVGQNALRYFLSSNLIIFACVALELWTNLNAYETLLVFVLIMGLIFFFQFITVDLSLANKTLNRKS